MQSKVVLGFIALMALASATTALKCYNGCFKVGGKEVAISGCTEQTCTAGQMCGRTTVWVLGGATATLNGCVTASSATCGKAPSGSLATGTQTCYCDKDLCNSAVSVGMFSRLTMFVTVCVAVFVIRH